MNKISKFNPEEVVIKVKPKDKNSAKLLVKIFHKNENDKRVEIIETFRWGIGFIEGSVFFNKDYKLNKDHIVCNPDVGDGNDLDDLFSIDFNYEGHWNDEEKNEFLEMLKLLLVINESESNLEDIVNLIIKK